jgi:hypothetical protein
LILERSVDYIKLLQQQVATLTNTCASLKDTIHRLGGDPTDAGASAASSSANGIVGLRKSSNAGSITIAGAEGGSSAASSVVDDFAFDDQEAMQP